MKSKKIIKKLKSYVRPLRIYFLRPVKKQQFIKRVLNHKQKGIPLKIVIGAHGVYDKSWIPSEEYILDLLDEKTWQSYFQENEIQCLLGEHVWEHLTFEQGRAAAQLCFKYLAHGGYLRLAVPDGFHKDENYIDYVKPIEQGIGHDDHKILYTIKTFTSVFEQVGFEVKPLEYFNENKKFCFNDWDKNKGMIHRSIRFDRRNIDRQPNYTSIIIDSYKP